MPELFLRAVLLAHIIASEAGVCGMDGKLAVAHVYANRGGAVVGWYGSAQPNSLDLYIALTWDEMPDPTHGARYLFGTTDRDQPAVQRLLKGRQQTTTFHCAGGLTLEAWR